MGCSGGETKRQGSSPDCNCWRVVLRVIADTAKVSKTAREAGSSAAPWPPVEDVVLCHFLLAWNFHPSIFAVPVSTHVE